MADNDGGKDHKIAINIVGAAICAALILTLTWQWSSKYTQNHIEANYYAEHYQAEAAEKIKQNCTFPDLVRRIECETQILSSAREAEHDAYDLEAQRGSAYWASWSVIVATAGAFVTLVGIWFVRENLLEMRRTTNATVQGVAAAERNHEAFLEQIRAHLQIKSAIFQKFERAYFLKVIIENKGQTGSGMGTIECAISYLHDGSNKSCGKTVMPFAPIAPQSEIEVVTRFELQSIPELAQFAIESYGLRNYITAQILWYDFQNTLWDRVASIGLKPERLSAPYGVRDHSPKFAANVFMHSPIKRIRDKEA